VKRIPLVVLACLVILCSLTGCAAIQDAVKTVENSLRTPPATVVTAGKMILDFLLGLFQLGLAALLHGVIPL